jgi:hypothetical protein
LGRVGAWTSIGMGAGATVASTMAGLSRKRGCDDDAEYRKMM